VEVERPVCVYPRALHRVRPRRQRVGELSEFREQIGVQTIEPVRWTKPVGGFVEELVAEEKPSVWTG
jgi:hypothetical protein